MIWEIASNHHEVTARINHWLNLVRQKQGSNFVDKNEKGEVKMKLLLVIWAQENLTQQVQTQCEFPK